MLGIGARHTLTHARHPPDAGRHVTGGLPPQPEFPVFSRQCGLVLEPDPRCDHGDQHEEGTSQEDCQSGSCHRCDVGHNGLPLAVGGLASADLFPIR